MVDTREERLNQEWTELLDEVRVVLPGTEVLFAFLLSLPFTDRFGTVARSDKTVYTVAFLAAALATLLLVAPSAQHRLLWRQQRKDVQLRIATAFALAGIACLAVAVSSVVFLVLHVLYAGVLPAVATAIAIAIIMLGWYGVPVVVRLRR
jgi:hypothetical protein